MCGGGGGFVERGIVWRHRGAASHPLWGLRNPQFSLLRYVLHVPANPTNLPYYLTVTLRPYLKARVYVYVYVYVYTCA